MGSWKNCLVSESEYREVQSHFQTAMDLKGRIQTQLRGVIEDSLEHPGSLIRGQLAFKLMTEAHLARETSKDIAIAIEYFHLASLIFDDLSCMDDATYRRGQMCVHKKYGEASAILGALAFINRAYSLIWSHESQLTSAAKTKIAHLLNDCLGPTGILNCQAYDLFYSPSKLEPESVTNIAKGKTVTLIRLSLLLPAMMSGASLEEETLLDRMAHFVGLSYQILDDFKDVFENLHVAGKSTNRDTLLSRPNYVLSMDKYKAFDRLKRLEYLNSLCIRRLEKKSARWSFLNNLQHFLSLEVEKLKPVLFEQTKKVANQ